jgi:hypothetical protein
MPASPASAAIWQSQRVTCGSVRVAIIASSRAAHSVISSRLRAVGGGGFYLT